jgi:hypothetical protein
MAYREYLTTDEERLYERIKVLTGLIGDQKVSRVVCPLAVTQLNDLEVMTRKAFDSIQALRLAFDESLKRDAEG